MSETSALASSHLAQIIREGVEEERVHAQPHPLWGRLRELGTELWLDTGDLDEATALWSAEFTALTTNNTLLNKEIQKGIYDAWIPRAAAAAREDRLDLAPEELVLEIAFALNARHGLRLVERFGAFVSVELHTDLAHDIERSLWYGRRYHAICPDRFIVKVPLTPEGLIAARRLEADGIPVNFTLGFSARENLLIAAVARPSWVNVFMGRLNAYAADEGLGDGRWVGERATLASQSVVRDLRGRLGTATRQIGASMRSGEQVETLAGLDVYTMPCAVTRSFLEMAPPCEAVVDRTAEDYQPTWSDGVDPAAEGFGTLWDVSADFRGACEDLGAQDPDSLDAAAIVEVVNRTSGGELFPQLGEGDRAAIAAEGKLPKRDRWQARIARGELGLDALFTLAGLFSFAQDQRALDDRIRQHLA